VRSPRPSRKPGGRRAMRTKDVCDLGALGGSPVSCDTATNIFSALSRDCARGWLYASGRKLGRNSEAGEVSGLLMSRSATSLLATALGVMTSG